jgi:hypothetical protein
MSYDFLAKNRQAALNLISVREFLRADARTRRTA